MQIIWMAWAIFGLITGVIVGVIMDKEKHSESGSDNGNNPCVTGEPDGMDRDIPTTPETARNILLTLRIKANKNQRAAIDYALECIHIRKRLDKFFEERGV